MTRRAVITLVCAGFVLTSAILFWLSQTPKEQQDAEDLTEQDMPSAQGAIIYVNIVSHNEDRLSPQYPDFLEDRTAFETQRAAVAAFARMLFEHDVKYNFQTDWNFLLGMSAYDDGHADTNGKNLLRYLVEDLGMSVDPHSHENEGYTYADVAYLIESLGVTPSGVVGGFIAAPASSSKLERLWEPVKGGRYDDAWTPEILWGGGTALHQNERDLWISGVWRPKSAVDFDTHDPDAPLPVVGHYTSDWEGLDVLLKKQEREELTPGLYTVTIMNNQRLLDEAYIQEFADRLETYVDETADGHIVWATIQDTYDAWVNLYDAQPTILHWDGAEQTPNGLLQGGSSGTCGDGICNPFELKMNTCELDC